jgi:hypothetical protein
MGYTTKNLKSLVHFAAQLPKSFSMVDYRNGFTERDKIVVGCHALRIIVGSIRKCMVTA